MKKYLLFTGVEEENFKGVHALYTTSFDTVEDVEKAIEDIIKEDDYKTREAWIRNNWYQIVEHATMQIIKSE